MKIGFFYPPCYPLTSGRAVHGYQLITGLQKHGHQLLSCLGEHYPGVVGFPRTYAGALQLARAADILYIRVASNNLERATLLKFMRPHSLPVVWELNAPAEELLESAFDQDAAQRRVNQRRGRLRMLARLTDGAVGVSRPVIDYLHDELGIAHTQYAPNGSDPQHFAPDQPLTAALKIESHFCDH